MFFNKSKISYCDQFGGLIQKTLIAKYPCKLQIQKHKMVIDWFYAENITLF